MVDLWIVLVLLGLPVLGYGARWALRKIPVAHGNLSPEKIQSLLRTLLNQGLEGSILVIEVARDQRFVQFRRCAGERGRGGIVFGYPRAPWSEPYYERVGGLVRELGFEYGRAGAGGAVVEFLEIDFGADVQRAERLTTAILARVYGVSPERDCVGRLSGDFAG